MKDSNLALCGFRPTEFIESPWSPVEIPSNFLQVFREGNPVTAKQRRWSYSAMMCYFLNRQCHLCPIHHATDRRFTFKGEHVWKKISTSEETHKVDLSCQCPWTVQLLLNTNRKWNHILRQEVEEGINTFMVRLKAEEEKAKHYAYRASRRI
jgi:hypothetical protein